MPTSINRTIITTAAALGAVLLSSCSLFGGNDGDPLDELREQIHSTVTDPERAGAMLASLDHLDELLVESAELMISAARQEREMFADYDSTAADFAHLFSSVSRTRQDLQEKMLKVHIDFKQKSTDEEWRRILPMHSDAVAARIESLVVAAVDHR